MTTIFAFDTATSATACSLLRDGAVAGERLTDARSVLAAADALVREAGLEPADIDALVVGTGPGASRRSGSASRRPAASRSRSASPRPASRHSRRSTAASR